MPAQQQQQLQQRNLRTLHEDERSGVVNGNPSFNEDMKHSLQKNPSFDSAAQSPGKASKYADLRYTKFTIGKMPGEKHAVFIPDSLAFSSSILEQICSVLDREAPSMLLCGVSSLCHPTKMSTAQLRKCPGFSNLMTEARSSMMPKATGELKDSDITNKKLVETVDEVLEKKIASSIGNVASAAFQTNVWTYTGPQISNFEIFLQQYIVNGETDAFRMVAAHMQDKAYMECNTSKEIMKNLFDNSQAMSPEAVDYFSALQIPGDLWDPEVNKSHPEFSEHGYDYWSFDSLDQKMISGHPITQFPWPHADLFLLFYREETITGANTPDVDWEWQTKAKLDEEALPFSPENLLPCGYVFIGAPYCWQPQMKRKLLHSIKMSSPVVVMDNTPNVAKQVGTFIKVIKKVWERNPVNSCKPFLHGERGIVGSNPNAVELIQGMSPAKIMKHIEREFDSSGMNADERLTLSDIVGLLDLVKRRPQAFRETVVTVDPLTDSTEQTVSGLMQVFTSSHSFAKEQTSTDIHRSLVLKAWDLHLKLKRHAAHKRRFATAMVVSIAFIMLLSTALAMVRVYLTLHRATVPHEVLLDISLVVLPITVLLLMTIQGTYQIAQSWASVHMGASRVVSEIYYFLGNIGPYKGNAVSNQKKFLKRMRDTVKRLSVSRIREEELVRTSSNNDQAMPTTDLETLWHEINESLYGIEPMCGPCRKLRDFLRSCCGAGSWTTLLLEGPEQKDLAAPVNAENYRDLRMNPLKKYYGDWMRSISRLRMILHCVLMLVLSVSVGLGATDFSIWIPVSLGFATFVVTITQWLAPPEIFGAVNNALTTLHKLDLRWQGYNIRDHRSEATKQCLISVTEKIVLAVERASSHATAVPEADDDEKDSDGEAEKDERTLELQREQRLRPISVVATPLNVGSGAATPLAQSYSRKDKYIGA